MTLSAESLFAPRPYSNFEKQYIGGTWRFGGSSKKSKDLNPYTQKPLLELPLANEKDVQEAYEAAASAQPPWGLSAAVCAG